MLKIIFMGLICHMTVGSHHMAVMPWHPDHDAVLIVPAGAEIAVPGAKTWGTPSVDGSGNRTYSIRNHRIQILGIPIGTETKLEPAFQTSVVSLKKATDGTFQSREVDDGTVTSGPIVSILDLEGGTLDVDKLWKCNVKNTQDGTSTCVAMSTIFQTNVSGGAIELVDEAGRRLRVAKNTTLTLSNEPINASIAGHFEAFKGLLGNATKIGTLKKDTSICSANGVSCDLGIHVECSNTQFP